MNNDINNSLNDIQNTDSAANEATEKKAVKAKKTFTTKQIILTAVLAVIASCAVLITVLCAVNDINPVSYAAGEMTKNQVVAKWQSQTAPGLSAYEFFEDGTYSSYISTFSFDGEYEIKGDKITLTNKTNGQSVIYKYAIIGDTLSLTLLEENGSPLGDKDPVKYDKVSSFNQKSINDLLDGLQQKAEDAAAAEE